MKLNVAIGDTEPINKSYGLMWLDTNDTNNDGENDNILKIYDGEKWLMVHF